MRISYYKESEIDDAEVCSILYAKKMLKEKGGSAWTEHYDRDGGLFEVSKIEVKGNNSKFKYNQHL